MTVFHLRCIVSVIIVVFANSSIDFVLHDTQFDQ